MADGGAVSLYPPAHLQLPSQGFEDSQGLLLDVVRAGAAVADCDAFMDYCLSQKILPLEDVAFWRCGDFFAPNPKKAGPLVDTLLDFVYRYGLPA